MEFFPRKLLKCADTICGPPLGSYGSNRNRLRQDVSTNCGFALGRIQAVSDSMNAFLQAGVAQSVEQLIRNQ
jgi:hypothetical protein